MDFQIAQMAPCIISAVMFPETNPPKWMIIGSLFEVDFFWGNLISEKLPQRSAGRTLRKN